MKPLILIVEDEPPLIEILKYNFEDAGFRTSLATDGDEGAATRSRRRWRHSRDDWRTRDGVVVDG